MKPTIKQLGDFKAKIVAARRASKLTNAQIAKRSRVHASQVGRICAGDFKTFSHNVVQICKVLGVEVPRLEPKHSKTMAPEWAQAISSMRRIWDDTPEGAEVITRMLDAIADLQTRGEGQTLPARSSATPTTARDPTRPPVRSAP